MEGITENGDKHTDSIKYEKFLKEQRNDLLLKNKSAPLCVGHPSSVYP
jgi:hypothetical protein